jgi:hypothetical protein
MFLVVEWLCVLPQDWLSARADRLAIRLAIRQCRPPSGSAIHQWSANLDVCLDAYGRHLLDVIFPKDVQSDISGLQVWALNGAAAAGVVCGGASPRANLPRQKVPTCKTDHLP